MPVSLITMDQRKEQMIYRFNRITTNFVTQRLKTAVVFCLCLVLLASCHSLPEHAKYIPKDAVVVAGINLKSLSKKIAWNVITGSKLFKEMQQRLPQKNAGDAVNDIEKSGIDFINTVYFYVKPDNRLKGGNRLCALVPLSDANDLENYFKKIIPDLNITARGDRKEAIIHNMMYLSWNKKLLVITNIMGQDGTDYMELLKNGGDSHSVAKPDMEENSAEMDNAFNVTAENSLINNKHFKSLETNGHDITVWVNYDQLMSQYMNETVAGKMGGLSVSNTLWKDAAFAAGFDFKTGRISGDLDYYVSEELTDIGKDLGSVDVDKDMTKRLPMQNMDMVVAWHLSPSGLKKSIDKTGLLGLVNLGLGSQGLTFDNVTDAFTGDMSFVISNLTVKTVVEEDDLMGQKVKHATQKPGMDMTFVIKMNKKENFMKMFDMYKEMAGFYPYGNDAYAYPLDTKDSLFFMINDKYMVASNRYQNVTGYISGKFKSEGLPSIVKSGVLGHPVGMVMDIAQIVKNIDPAIVSSPRDSAVLAVSKNLLSSISINGGTFKNNSFGSHIDINFTNSDENSIIALMDYGLKISDAEKLNSDN